MNNAWLSKRWYRPVVAIELVSCRRSALRYGPYDRHHLWTAWLTCGHQTWRRVTYHPGPYTEPPRRLPCETCRLSSAGPDPRPDPQSSSTLT